MFKWLLDNSLTNRLLVIIASVVLMAYGAFTLSTTPVDVFPDLNKPTVTIMTEAGGMAAEEVEQLITFPLTLLGFGVVLAAGQEQDLFMWQAVLAGLATLISGAITTPFSAGVDALMTIDQRIRREGLDVQLIHAAQEGGPAPWPSAARAR